MLGNNQYVVILTGDYVHVRAKVGLTIGNSARCRFGARNRSDYMQYVMYL
jgi:hypothetical protein